MNPCSATLHLCDLGQSCLAVLYHSKGNFQNSQDLVNQLAITVTEACIVFWRLDYCQAVCIYSRLLFLSFNKDTFIKAITLITSDSGHKSFLPKPGPELGKGRRASYLHSLLGWVKLWEPLEPRAGGWNEGTSTRRDNPFNASLYKAKFKCSLPIGQPMGRLHLNFVNEVLVTLYPLTLSRYTVD